MTTLLNAMDAVKDGKALDGPILIFEDDVYLDNNFKSVTTKALSFLDENFPDWAIFGIGSCITGDLARFMGSPVIVNVEGFVCLHAYILKNSAAALKLFDAMNTTYVQIADLGWHYLATGRNPSLPAYIYLPNNVCHQNRQDHPSEISVS
jgi:hypothetical protein